MNIDEQIEQLNFRDSDQVIDFYQSNELYFENYQRLKNPYKIGKFIDVKLFYCNYLTDKQHVNKVLKVLKHINELLIKLPKDYWNYKSSERHYRFLKAMALSNQKKFKESYPIFKSLKGEDSDNNHYKVWFDHAQIGLYNWKFNIIYSIGIGCLIGDIVLSELGIKLPFDIGRLGLVIVGIAYLTQLAIKEYIKRKK